MSFLFVAREKQNKRKRYSLKARIDFQRSRTFFLLYPSILRRRNPTYINCGVYKSAEYTGCIKGRITSFLDEFIVDFFLKLIFVKSFYVFNA